MPSVTTQAIVLRHADYRENDRMLTLLSPGMGRLEALCRGCKRVGSPLLSASEFFAMGEYVLYTGRGRMTVTSCHLAETFYPLRTDYDRLKYAAYLLTVTEAAAQPGERAAELFTLLARSLGRLAYGERDMRAVAAAFLIHFAAINGYRPRLRHCVRCGRELADNEITALDVSEGGLVCPDCREPTAYLLPLRPAQVRWMLDVLKIGIDRTALPDTDAPFAALVQYIAPRLEKNISLKGLI